MEQEEEEEELAEFVFTPLIFGDLVNFTMNATFTVVDTDYNNYAIVVMC